MEPEEASENVCHLLACKSVLRIVLLCTRGAARERGGWATRERKGEREGEGESKRLLLDASDGRQKP